MTHATSRQSVHVSMIPVEWALAGAAVAIGGSERANSTAASSATRALLWSRPSITTLMPAATKLAPMPPAIVPVPITITRSMLILLLVTYTYNMACAYGDLLVHFANSLQQNTKLTNNYQYFS